MNNDSIMSGTKSMKCDDKCGCVIRKTILKENLQ
jgi:hypothetical protein